MNVLLIEPDKILGSMLMDTLKKAGHRTVWCRTAQSGLDALEPEVPDVIILELQLGMHNGIEFLYEVRTYSEWQQVPIIIHTINANVLDDRFVKPLTQLGVRTVLYKPRTSSKRLIRAITQFVSV